MNNISLVIEREYRSRVVKKSFIITTILMPLVMLALMCAPALLMIFSGPENTVISVIDDSNTIVDKLSSNKEVTFEKCEYATVEEAQKANPNAYVLVIPDNVLDNKNAQLRLFCNGPSSMAIEGAINNQVNQIIEDKRLSTYGIADIDKILADVKSNVSIQAIRSDKNDEASSTELSYVLGIVLSFVLYMFMLLYGQMVMTSIIEEKNNRVLEVVVSSVKPVNIMMGKIIGIALVALTQIVIWAVLTFLMVAFILPVILPDTMMADIAAVNAGNAAAISASSDLSMIQAFSHLTNLGYIAGIFGIMTLFLIGGFLFYSAIYAAIGSSVDNIQDASQLNSITILPILIGMVCSMAVAANPTTPMAFWLSLIPFTSPMVMMARLPFGIPAWQTILSFVLLAASFIGMCWVAAKIYRVGIFMYGKKPTFKDLIRWINYK